MEGSRGICLVLKLLIQVCMQVVSDSEPHRQQQRGTHETCQNDVANPPRLATQQGAFYILHQRAAGDSCLVGDGVAVCERLKTRCGLVASRVDRMHSRKKSSSKLVLCCCFQC